MREKIFYSCLESGESCGERESTVVQTDITLTKLSLAEGMDSCSSDGRADGFFFLRSRGKVRGCAVDPATESDGSEGFSDLCSGSLHLPPSACAHRSFDPLCWVIVGQFFFAWEDGTLLGRAAGLTHAPPPFNPALFSIWAGKSVIKKRSRFGFGERKKEKE